MNTLIFLIHVWGIYSIVRTYKYCKQEDISFNPFELDFVTYMGCLIGVVMLLIDAIYLITTYLP